MSRRRIALAATAFIAAAALYVVVKAPPGPRSLRIFDPDRVADLEVDMWQAYYRKDNVRLFGDLVTLFREQYRYSWSQAAITGFFFARAARTFALSRTADDRVLPDLERAYTQVRAWMNADFDPVTVARAELAWWNARRIPGEDSPDNVGRLIAEENAQIFQVEAGRLLAASVLRARAGRLRDEGGEGADWVTVSSLLHDSYRQLHDATAGP